MLEGKNLPKFTMKATSSQAAKGRKQVIADDCYACYVCSKEEEWYLS